jgi:hypothetical protein
MIVVPPPPTPTPTIAPTQAREVAAVINTPAPTPTPAVLAERPAPTPNMKKVVRFKTAPYFILLLFVGLFAFTAMTDPRPRQWRRVAKAIQKMNEIDRK